MASVALSSDPAADLLQKLSLESQSNPLEVPKPTKKASAYKHGSVDAKEANGATQPSDRSATPVLPEFVDPNFCYPYNGYSSSAYFYGYNGSMGEYDDYSRYLNTDGAGVYGDNGSYMYGFGYSPYSPYSPAGSPVPTMGHDGQLYGPQQYQYPTYYQSPAPPNEPFKPNEAPASQELSTSVSVDKPALSVEVPNGNAKGSVNANTNGSMPLKPCQQNSSLNSNGSYGRGGVFPGSIPASGFQDYRYNVDGLKSRGPWLDVPAYNDGKHRPATSSAFSTVSHANNIQAGRNQNVRPHPNITVARGMQSPRTPGLVPSHAYLSGLYPNNRMYGQYGSHFRTGCGFGSNGYDSRYNGRNSWLSFDNKYKPKGRYFGYGNENMDGLNELNRGPRSRGLKNQKTVTLAVKGQDISSGVSTEKKDISSVTPGTDQYNREDFPVKYTDAKFFIIKSYSEDDVHKSIKYSVWASTPNGNKKLNVGYQESQEKSGNCPVFLCFSVNGSGQFVGLAEMVGPVDFDKSVEYWQQDKWNGCFPVKWHIVKDIPNSLLKQITLENNDNKPVTNSRDTQEVKLEQGLHMLKIFKDHSCKTCILDDFEFYEGRQKTVQEKKAKLQLVQKQAWEGKRVDAAATIEKENEVTNGKVQLQRPLEVGSALTKEAAIVQIDVDCKQSEENEVDVAKNAPMDAKPVALEGRPLANGVANGC
ncbi:Yth domain-containing protein ect2 [Thalictrum thalictroides]|uniref:YTH domain-containing family protein n=1 Tax=Thalictrum thalictroides TaxID=46969 RepID=A0A7J6VKJ9_THATH|nr:Yth domain-containing protein ect2 [Thalictrum thalictroides]